MRAPDGRRALTFPNIGDLATRHLPKRGCSMMSPGLSSTSDSDADEAA